MFCKQCGTEIAEGAAFCSKCGASQGAEVQAQPKANANRYETKVVQVHPDNEMSTIEKFEAFGWQVAHSQTVETKDSHLERGIGGSISSVTEHVKYVKLSFRRYLNIPNYARLVELEEQYDTAVLLDEAPPKKKKWASVTGGICIAMALLGMPGDTGNFLLDFLGNIIMAAIGILFFLIAGKHTKKYQQEMAEWQELNSENAVEQQNLLAEAKSLL